MLKYIFVTLNVAFIMGFGRFMGGSGPDIVQVFPTGITTSSSFTLDLNITKPDDALSFGKVEQQLPKGFVATAEDLKGGILSQDENDMVKIIWYQLPSSKEFTIKLKILVTDDMKPGEFTTTARFAYLENNEKKSIKSSEAKITVTQGEIKPKQPEVVQKVPDTTFHRLMTDNIDKMLKEAGVACTQVSEMVGKHEVRVDVRIMKGKLTGFCKIEESICEGLTPRSVENGGGVFSFADGKVKYVWTDVPEGSSINVSFILTRNAEAGWLKECKFDGEFSYLQNDKSMKCKLNSIGIDFEKASTAAVLPNMPEPVAQQSVAVVGDPDTTAKTAVVPAISATGDSAAVAGQPSGARQMPGDNSPTGNTTSGNENTGNTSAGNTTTGNTTTGNQAGTQLQAEKPGVTDSAAGSTAANPPPKGNETIVNATIQVNKESGNTNIERVHEMANKGNEGTVNQQNNAGTANEGQGGTGENAKETTAGNQQPDKPVKQYETVTGTATTGGMAGLVFRVQVCATHRNVDAPAIKTIYKLPEEVNFEMHEGWNKFTIGVFALYREARDKRETLGPYNLPGPFVTAYNNGQRITVQEALMISKQTWVK